jgi:hypothetical protein
MFGDDDGKMFIYRELKLAGIFDVSGRLGNMYNALYGKEKIEILTDSGLIDRRLLNPEKGHIQITSVTPYFPKGERKTRETVFENSTNLRFFKFEAPFLKGEKKLQGSVDSQWIRRTILKTNTSVPGISKRQLVPVAGLTIIEYEPIQVAGRQLKERLKAYRQALATRDMAALQPLLHGSLMTAVNEGPAKFAEVFLSGSAKTKHTERLRASYQQFLEVNREGLQIMDGWVQTNTQFAELFKELQAGMVTLTDKLAPYLALLQR